MTWPSARRSSTPSGSRCPAGRRPRWAGPRVAGSTCTWPAPDAVQIACDETTTDEHVREVAAALCGLAGRGDRAAGATAPARCCRRGCGGPREFLTHPVFHAHRTETAMLRYLRRLADFDIALDRSMIPLGSCTMKLNATTEMEPITWPEFAGLHPFAPADAGRRLRRADRRPGAGWLAEITGYDAVSRAAQRRVAGRAGRAAGHPRLPPVRGAAGADVCLIPESAHGTNAASAVLAGLRVVVVKCGADGAIDLGDLRAKLAGTRARSPRSWSPTRPPTACSRRPSREVCDGRARRPAARCTSTGPTSTRWSGWPGRAGSARTCRT